MFSKILTATTISALLAVGSTSAVLAQDAYKARSDAMKSMGDMAKTIGGMLQGKTDFDAAAANAAMISAKDSMAGFEDLFPDGSEGGESEAAASIWTDPDGFAAAVVKVQGDLDTAIGQNPQTKEDVQAAFGMVAANCKSCHEEYRIKK